MIKIECDKKHPPLKVESCGTWVVLAEEAANIVKALTVSLLKDLSPTVQREAAEILKEAIAMGYREGLKKLKEEEVAEHETAD
jgi:hypothetical protein